MTAPQESAELERRLQDLQQQLMQAQKLSTIGSLASSMTHEFNNILTTIINYAKLGLRHKDNATREKALDKILAAGQRASRITTGLLSYARRGGNRREPTDLVSLTQEVLVLAEKDLQMHRARLQTQFEGRPVIASVNAGQLQQVLLNLVVNARQAMPNGGQLTVAVRSNEETATAEIAVRDTGHGIPAETLRKIFDPYFTTKTADAQGQGGTGLGLSLAREVIEAHQGRIRVESAVGQGTTFILKLPLAKERILSAREAPHAASENAAPSLPVVPKAG
ncbi:MAG: sensor histidine kinase [Planctomycetaceae bacterium]